MGKAKTINAKEIITIMEVCGTHTEVISKYAIRKLYEGRVKLISGPGCPVCVTSTGEIDEVIEYAEKGFTVATFGDLLKVPGTSSSLAREKALGANIKTVYSPLQALELAKKNPKKPVIFVGIGFETTAPLIALTIKKAKKDSINNFSVLSLHKTMPAILHNLLENRVLLDGLLLPGHVCTIIGANAFGFIAKKYDIIGVVSGFTPEDVVESIETIITNVDNPFIHTQYQRAVTPNGNGVAQQVVREVFEHSDSCWRGFGIVKNSGLAIKKEWSFFDARKRYGRQSPNIQNTNILGRNCCCGDIVKGQLTPPECPLFKTNCSPLDPQGPCMASTEGSCSIYYKFGG